MRRRSSQRGSILIIVLWISIGLAAIALTFAHTSIMAYQGSDNELAGAQAQWAIDGGAQYVSELLTNNVTPGAMLAADSYEAEALPVGEGTFWLLGGPGDDNTLTSTQPIFGLVDEASKINLNMDKALLTQLLPNLLGMTDELSDAILDWVDEDNEVTNSGAESETYALRKPAYGSKNGPFESLEELALVNGASFEILYGEDANLNGVLDPNEDDGEESAPVDNADGKLDPGILPYLTCFSRETNMTSDGTEERVDVATYNVALAAYLSTTLGADDTASIRTSLSGNGVPVTTADSSSPPPPAAGGATPAPGAGAAKPPGAGGTTSAGTPIKSVMEFYIKSGMTADQFAQIVDHLWVAPTSTSAAAAKKYVVGLINVNTASETVLSCIPGIGTDKASTIVAARTQRATQDTNIAWLRDALGDADALLAGPFVTGRSYQVSADIAAVGRHGRGYRRTRFVIDMSTGVPRIIYRRNLSSLGWAIGADARQTLAARKEETK